MTTDTLRATLTALLQSGTQANPAFNELLSDYAKYHLVLVIVGGLFTVAFIAIGVFCWLKYKKASKVEDHKWTFFLTIGSLKSCLIVYENIVFPTTHNSQQLKLLTFETLL